MSELRSLTDALRARGDELSLWAADQIDQLHACGAPTYAAALECQKRSRLLRLAHEQVLRRAREAAQPSVPPDLPQSLPRWFTQR